MEFSNYGELANGVIAIGHKNADGTNTNYYSHYISFYNPSNGTVWQEPNLYDLTEQTGYSLNTNGNIKLRAVYGNTIIGTAEINTGSPVGYFFKLFAFDLTNQTRQVSTNLGNAQYSHYDIVSTNIVTFGDHIFYGLACGNNIANSCPAVGGGRQAAVAWSPGAIAVNDAWNISAGDRLDGPISGGDGRFYNSGVGVQNLTASSEGAEVMVGDLMDEITFQYDSSAASGSGSNSNLGRLCKSPTHALLLTTATEVGDGHYVDAEVTWTPAPSSMLISARAVGWRHTCAISTTRQHDNQRGDGELWVKRWNDLNAPSSTGKN